MASSRTQKFGRGRPSWEPQRPIDSSGGPASEIFDQFCSANTFQTTMTSFQQLCDILELNPSDHLHFYAQLKSKLTTWKAQSLWAKLDKRASHRDYDKGRPCRNTRVLIIGAGPCGLRTAIELAMLGAKVVIVEKRDRFSRNNVLHLWPFLIHDLKQLGAKKFFGKFCAGAIDHISIRTLQCILLKTALLLGIEVHTSVAYVDLAEPQADTKVGWKVIVDPKEHPVSEFEFDVLIGADGKRNTLPGFKRKEFRGKLAIAITANFINHHSQAEASVEEISGVAFIFNQKFFKDLNQKTGIDLENIVYYKDETHYFVMTAKKNSLLEKGVLLYDYDNTAMLLSKENVDQKQLMLYAKEAANVSTNNQLPDLEYAHNHYGQPDVAMFDFTSLYAAAHASRVIERHGYKLLVGLVGDSLLEPFWPTGSGCARGFLGAFDAAWMVKGWASGKMTPLEVMAERESIYQQLSQTTPDNLHKNFHQYCIDPSTRYPTTHFTYLKPIQVKSQYDGSDSAYLDEIVQISEQKSKRYDWIRDSTALLKWFQKQLEPYRNTIKVLDLTSSWKNGLALSALIHKYRPELINIYSLDPNEVSKNCQKAFDIAEKEFGILPVMSGEDMASCDIPDKLTMVSYLSQFYDYFRKESIRPAKIAKTPEALKKKDRIGKTKPMFNKARSKREEAEKENSSDDASGRKEPRKMFEWKRKKDYETISGMMQDRFSKFESGEVQETKSIFPPTRKHDLGTGKNIVGALAKDLAVKFSGKKPSPPQVKKQAVSKMEPKPLIMGQLMTAENCYFCKKRVYLMERHTAEGVFFHRGCFRCEYCCSNLRVGAYACQKLEDKTMKFYCFQHYGMKKKVRKLPKRANTSEIDGASQNTRTKSPPGRQTAWLGVPGMPFDPNKTPERIEYTTESEMEESEIEQTFHNLSTSQLGFSDLESDSETDSDSSTEVESEREDIPEGDMEFDEEAEITPKLPPKQKSLHRGDEETETETETEGAGTSGDEGDWESATDTEVEDDMDFDTYMSTAKRTILKERDINKALILSTTPLKPPPPKETKPSPTSQKINQNRMAFFSAATEPVRIDAMGFLGLRPPPLPPPLPEPEPEPEDVKEESDAKEKSEEEKTNEEVDFSSERNRDGSSKSEDETLSEQISERSVTKSSDLDESVTRKKKRKKRKHVDEQGYISTDEEDMMYEEERWREEFEYDEGTLKKTPKTKRVSDEVVAIQVGVPEKYPSMELVALSQHSGTSTEESSTEEEEEDKTIENLSEDESESLALDTQVQDEIQEKVVEPESQNLEQDMEVPVTNGTPENDIDIEDKQYEAMDEGTAEAPPSDVIHENNQTYTSSSESDFIEDESKMMMEGYNSVKEEDDKQQHAPLASMDSEMDLPTSCSFESFPCSEMESEDNVLVKDECEKLSQQINDLTKTCTEPEVKIDKTPQEIDTVLQELSTLTQKSAKGVKESSKSVDEIVPVPQLDQKSQKPENDTEKPKPSQPEIRNPVESKKCVEEKEKLPSLPADEQIFPQKSEKSLSSPQFKNSVLESQQSKQKVEKPIATVSKKENLIDSQKIKKEKKELLPRKSENSTKPALSEKSAVPHSNTDKNDNRKDLVYANDVDKKTYKRVERTDTVIENVSVSPSTTSEEISTGNKELKTNANHTTSSQEIKSQKTVSKKDEPVHDVTTDDSVSLDESFVTSRARRHKLDQSLPLVSSPSQSSTTLDNSVQSSSSTSDVGCKQGSVDNLSFDLLVGDFPSEDTISIDGILENNLTASDQNLEKSLLRNITNDKSKTWNNASHSEPTNNSEKSDKKKLFVEIEPIGESSTDPDVKTPKTPKSEPEQIYSPHVLIDAKRKFFFDTAQPVRIDPKNVFADLRPKPKDQKSPKRDLVKDLAKDEDKGISEKSSVKDDISESSKEETDPNPKFPEKVTAHKSKSLDCELDGDLDTAFVVPENNPKKLITRKGSNDLEREKARQAARYKAQMMSDEELGLDSAVYTSRKTSTSDVDTVDNTDTHVKGKHKRGDSNISTTSEPSQRVCSMSEASFESNDSSNKCAPMSMSDEAPTSPASKKKTPSSPLKSPKPAAKNRKDKKQKQETPSQIKREKGKEERKDNSEKKEKRKSLLSMLLPIKGGEKKDTKENVKSKEKSQRDGRSSLPRIKGKQGAKIEEKLEEQKENRTSVYEELKPIVKDLNTGVALSKKTKERLQEVAPGPSKPPELRVAPRAIFDDEFDTESLLSEDRMSLKSFQSQGMSDEDLAKLLKRQKRAASKQRREQELKRLRVAQEIQRQLEEVETKQREIEEKGVAIEQALRGEGEGEDANRNEAELMQDWFNVVHEKNILVRYESELMVHARELELEDRHSRLDQQLRDRMSVEEVKKTSSMKEEESKILEELLEVVEQRDALVSLLEEDRLREREEDSNLENLLLLKGFQLSPMTYSRTQSVYGRTNESDVR